MGFDELVGPATEEVTMSRWAQAIVRFACLAVLAASAIGAPPTLIIAAGQSEFPVASAQLTELGRVSLPEHPLTPPVTLSLSQVSFITSDIATLRPRAGWSLVFVDAGEFEISEAGSDLMLACAAGQAALLPGEASYGLAASDETPAAAIVVTIASGVVEPGSPVGSPAADITWVQPSLHMCEVKFSLEAGLSPVDDVGLPLTSSRLWSMDQIQVTWVVTPIPPVGGADPPLVVELDPPPRSDRRLEIAFGRIKWEPNAASQVFFQPGPTVMWLASGSVLLSVFTPSGNETRQICPADGLVLNQATTYRGINQLDDPATALVVALVEAGQPLGISGSNTEPEIELTEQPGTPCA